MDQPRVTELEEVVGGGPAPGLIVAEHGGNLTTRQVRVDEDEGRRERAQEVLMPLRQAACRDNHAVDAPLEEEVQVGDLAFRILGRVAEDDRGTHPLGGILRAADDLRVERVVDVRHDEPERPGLLAAQRPSHSRRAVPQLGDRCLNLSRAAGLTRGEPCRTRLTVAEETPDRAATSVIVVGMRLTLWPRSEGVIDTGWTQAVESHDIPVSISRPLDRATKGDPMTNPTDVVLVPHTHWDREWYLPFQVFRVRLVEMIDRVLDQLEADERLSL